MRELQVIRPEPPMPSWLQGPRWQVKERAREMQRRGEIQIVGEVRPVIGKPGIVAIPYHRLMSRRQARMREVRNRALLWGGAGLVWSGALGWLIWESRHVLMAGAGALLAVGSILFLATRARHSGACSGLHCSGCRG